MIYRKKNPFILVDGSSYLYRAYYALPTLTNSMGEPTGAIYGVLNMLKSLLRQYKPTNMAIIFDAPSKNFREKLFKYYKYNRDPMPDSLKNQIKPLYDIIKAMGLPLLVISGVEADDVIGTLALEAASHGKNVLISTSDKDMAQLVSSDINLINTMSNTIFTLEKVQRQFGISPKLIVDYLSLIGDSADNIPGVPGIGKKTAIFLLQQIGSLKTLYKNINLISSLNFRGAKNIALKLENHRKIAFLSYKLASIKTNVILDSTYDQLKVEEIKLDELVALIQRFELKKWIMNLKQSSIHVGKIKFLYEVI